MDSPRWGEPQPSSPTARISLTIRRRAKQRRSMIPRFPTRGRKASEAATLKVIVTGGFGYVGGRLGQVLAGAGHSVVLVSRRPRPVPNWLRTATVVSVDWHSERDLEACCESADAVAHLAGMNAADCAAHPTDALAFNGLATSRLVAAATRRGVRRFLYLSTAHVYASPLRGNIEESTCAVSLHPYATSHRAGEDAVLSADRIGTIEGVVARLSNAFGPPTDAQVDCWGLLANDLCRQASRTGRMVLRSSPHIRRDFIPMHEACRALLHLLEAPRVSLSDGLINVGSGRSASSGEIADQIAHRVTMVVGQRPAIEMPAVDPDAEQTLSYSRARLIESGFAPGPPEATDNEIGELVRFCVHHFPSERH